MASRPLKSILLKLNSSFKEINWRCLHKLFSKLWNNQTSGASCLSRCLIYKVHTVRFTFSVSRRVLSLSLHPAFVKNFFQVFSNFFRLFHSLSGLVIAALAGDLISLPQAVSLVKNFFQVLLTFFSSDRYDFRGKKRTANAVRLCWRYLFSRSVSRQVSSAEMSLTSVFGMGTGGPSF